MKSESLNILDRINDAIILFDKKGKINYVNKAFAEVANYEPSNMIGKNIWELLPKLADSTVYKNVTEAIEKNKSMIFEWSGPYTNKIWETKVFLSFDGVTAIGRDITERKKAEKAIALMNKKLTSIYKSINDVFLSLDNNWNFIHANDHVKDFMGIDSKDLIGKNYWKLFPKAAGTIVEENLRAAMEKKQARSYETKGMYSGKWANVRIFPSAEGITVLISDITERKKAEEALQISEEKYRLLVEGPNSIVMTADKNLNITYMNKFGLDFFGYSADEILGKNVLGTTIPLKDRSGNDLSVMAKDILLHSERYKTNVHQNMRKDGSLVWVSWTNSVRCDKEGNALEILAVGNDISDLMKAEGALKESEQLYKTIFDNSEDGFMLVEILFDESGKPIDQKYLKINQAFCKQTGIKEKDIIGKTLRQVLPKIEPSWLEIADQVLKTGKPIHTENYNQDTCRYYDLYCFPFAEKTVGALFRDITQRKTLELQLQEKERLAAIGATAGMVGHDIRNPLQAITGDVYLLRDYLSGMPDTISVKHDVAESLGEIEENVGYINKIVADLQDYSRAIRPELKELNLYDLVTSAFRSLAIPENVNPSIEIDPKINLKTDRTLFTRILTNLVINAFQAMPKGGDLSIVADKKQDSIIFSVEDTGVGIPEDVKPKLFTPMMTTKAKGQGLGLAVVKRLVEALEGTISFESQEGKGTKFTIQLPITTQIIKF